MQRCLELALLGLGKVSPNPMVGAVLVYRDEIMGEGWHQKYGEAHAEVNAINDALKNLNRKYPDFSTENSHAYLKESTLYVSLEPCSHYGKTPPCTELILKHKIPVVVIGSLDSNPLVSGKGVKILREQGVLVETGILEKESRFLNRRFFTYFEQKRPYIILKWAENQYNIMAPVPYEPYWISSPLSQRLNHRWRTEEDAILIGTNTVKLDNPLLTSRHWSGKNPKRVILDWNLEIPLGYHIYNKDSETYIMNGLKQFHQENIHYLQIEHKEYFIQSILFQLYLNNIQSVLVEGGYQTLYSFIALGIWDEARIIHSEGTGLKYNQEKIVQGLVAPVLPKTSYLFSKTPLKQDTILNFLQVNPENI